MIKVSENIRKRKHIDAPFLCSELYAQAYAQEYGDIHNT